MKRLLLLAAVAMNLVMGFVDLGEILGILGMPINELMESYKSSEPSIENDNRSSPTYLPQLPARVRHNIEIYENMGLSFEKATALAMHIEGYPRLAVLAHHELFIGTHRPIQPDNTFLTQRASVGWWQLFIDRG